jgi:hypothetical protein
MRTATHTTRVLGVTVAMIAAVAMLTGTASAKRKFCLAVSADGYSYPVRVLKGEVSCTTARAALKRYIVKFTAPSGRT